MPLYYRISKQLSIEIQRHVETVDTSFTDLAVYWVL